MKRYRLTKIKVKTREIVRLSNDAAHDHETAFCPVCHAPLKNSLTGPETGAPELLPAGEAETAPDKEK